MGKSFYAKEQEKIKALIKLPLLELVLKFLPHLQLTQKEKDDTWEIIAIQLTQIRFSESIAEKKSIEEIEELPELNGMYIRDYFDEIYQEFLKTMQFRIAEWNQAEALGRRLPFWFNPKDRVDTILYQLYQLRGRDIEIMAMISLENLENTIRKKLDRELKIADHQRQGHDIKNNDKNNTKAVEVTDATATDDGDVDTVFDSSELVEEYRKSLEKQKNDILRQELIRMDKRLQQLTQENKRLLELNHDLLRLL